MRVFVYPGDQTGCGHYRLIWAAEHLRSQGHDVHVRVGNQRNEIGASVDVAADAVIDVHYREDVDVVVVQRPTHKFLAQAVPLLREKGVAVVVEVDDDLAHVHPHNPAFAAMHPSVSRRDPTYKHSWAHVTQACRYATLVQVSTAALVDSYDWHGNARVVDNYVPGWYLTVPRVDSDVLGYPGSTHSHPDDLPQVGSALAELEREGHPFHQVGAKARTRELLRLRGEPLGPGPVELDRYPAAVAQLGVALAPLADTRFNRAKSRLKPLECAALGVPVVMSPRAEYRRLHRELGVGVLAATPREWHRHLKTLLEDGAARERLSQQQRAAVLTETIERNSWRWLELWAEALKLQRD